MGASIMSGTTGSTNRYAPVTSVGPSFEELRPGGEPIDPGKEFPVYADLADQLTQQDSDSADIIRHVMATCSAYAYGDRDVVATMMTRMGLEKCNVAEISVEVDAMLLHSTAYLVQ